MQPQAAGLLEQIFRDTVVVRGEGPMAPRDPIVLKLPNDAQMVPEGVQQEEGSRFAGGNGPAPARTGDHRGPLRLVETAGPHPQWVRPFLMRDALTSHWSVPTVSVPRVCS
ncbi:hypothetical protein GCM10011428_85000 [Streptomyces violaceus]